MANENKNRLLPAAPKRTITRNKKCRWNATNSKLLLSLFIQFESAYLFCIGSWQLAYSAREVATSAQGATYKKRIKNFDQGENEYRHSYGSRARAPLRETIVHVQRQFVYYLLRSRSLFPFGEQRVRDS